MQISESETQTMAIHPFGGEWDAETVDFNFRPDLRKWITDHPGLFVKLGLAAPTAFYLLSVLSTGTVEAGTPLQPDTPFNFPVEFGDGALAGFLENCINKPVDSVEGLGMVGAVIGSLRLLLQIPGVWTQLTNVPDGQEVNYTSVLTRLGGLFYTNTLSEALQYARLPLLVAGTYWFNELAKYAPPEVSSMFKMTALVMAGVTFISTIEALDPFH